MEMTHLHCTCGVCGHDWYRPFSKDTETLSSECQRCSKQKSLEARVAALEAKVNPQTLNAVHFPAVAFEVAFEMYRILKQLIPNAHSIAYSGNNNGLYIVTVMVPAG
jgi:hypothetical protein